ncbi:hypothetical protein M2454_002379 [Aequitasia blattaphilus]|uniref:DUF3021 domain-containing protein n=1 Tax=Aequitasia blattaphilus TaxID=2949332 RepID=A0ABT1EAG2_9FIRM|nr:hypothetical protein [Aequitasia blattaphilus]MCP1102810.1 hypothetical protein [Aequitasia blattaphilus]MCR8615450.1 hypothetical protein [Aequitasia blattaphilus]
MRALRVLRNISLIFSVGFTLTVSFTLFMGVEYTAAMVLKVLLLLGIYAVMALVFFWKKLIEAVGYLPIEIFYVVMLNAVYIGTAPITGWFFSVRGYILNTIFSVIAYGIVKLIIFSIDYTEAKRINEILKKRKEGENH